MDNKDSKSPVETGVDLEEVRKQIQQAQPWFRIVVPQMGRMIAWLSLPEAEIFREYLAESIKLDFERMLAGSRDKNNNDLTDIYRGMIVGRREIYNMKTSLETQHKSDKEREEEKKKQEKKGA